MAEKNKDWWWQMAEQLGLPRVEVDYSFQKVVKTSGPYCRQILGLAEDARDGRWVTLFEGGQNVGTLLHELAHQMPGGGGHGAVFFENYRKLAEWWNQRQQKKAA
jgi:hypothetical protein